MTPSQSSYKPETSRQTLALSADHAERRLAKANPLCSASCARMFPINSNDAAGNQDTAKTPTGPARTTVRQPVSPLQPKISEAPPGPVAPVVAPSSGQSPPLVDASLCTALWKRNNSTAGIRSYLDSHHSKVIIQWIPGHSDFAENELADSESRKTAVTTISEAEPTSLRAALSCIRRTFKDHEPCHHRAKLTYKD